MGVADICVVGEWVGWVGKEGVVVVRLGKRYSTVCVVGFGGAELSLVCFVLFELGEREGRVWRAFCSGKGGKMKLM